MALAAAVVTRIQQAYMGAVKSQRMWVLLDQTDVRAILLGNNGADTVAAAYSPSRVDGISSPDGSAA